MSRGVEKTVFISYRRTDEAWALAIYQTLRQRGFDVFIDYVGLGSGSFEQEILENIAARAHFLVLLTLHSLDRVDEPNDWMRREIERAIDLQRNVIPVMLGKFRFDAPEVQPRLTGKLALLQQYNGLSIPEGYFNSAIERLERQYLNIKLDTVLHPPSAGAQLSVARQQTAADRAIEVADHRPEALLLLSGSQNAIDPNHEDTQRPHTRDYSGELVGLSIAPELGREATFVDAHPDLVNFPSADDTIAGTPPRQLATDSEQVLPNTPAKVVQKSPPLQPITDFARLNTQLLIAVTSLAVVLGIFAILAGGSKLLARLSLVEPLWIYALQLLGGLAAASCLSSSLKSYTAFSGKMLGRALEIGSPIVLMLTVVLLETSLGPGLDPRTGLSLTITAPAIDKLHFATLDSPNSEEWDLTIQPEIINSLIRSGQYPGSTGSISVTLASLLLPTRLAALISESREMGVRILVNQDTARFPWEAVFGSASGKIEPVSVIRSLAVAIPPGSQHSTALEALLICNPSTRGTQAKFGLRGEFPELKAAEMSFKTIEQTLSRGGFSVTPSVGKLAEDVLIDFFRTDYRIVLISAHGLSEYETPSGAIFTGVPLSDGAMLTSRVFEQMKVPPDLVVLDSPGLAKIGDGPDREAVLQRFLPARLLMGGVRTVVAIDYAINDKAAAVFMTTFMESLIDGRQTIAEAALTARRRLLQHFPNETSWSAYQLYGIADYRIDSLR